MKVQVVSDLHLDHHRDGGKKFIKKMDGTDVDALVIAGDLTEVRFLDQALALFEAICAKYKKIIYVPGNHDYYDSSPDQTDGILKAIAAKLGDKLLILDHDRVYELGGRRLLGGTMWFPYDPMNPVYARLWNDFHLIKGFVPWVYDKNATFNVFIKNRLQAGDIVVTHHLPSPACVAARYKDDDSNRFFVNDLTDLILDRKPALWIHGHTHSTVDLTLGSTRIVCNPLGYPEEFNPFNPKLVIEI